MSSYSELNTPCGFTLDIDSHSKLGFAAKRKNCFAKISHFPRKNNFREIFRFFAKFRFNMFREKYEIFAK